MLHLSSLSAFSSSFYFLCFSLHFGSHSSFTLTMHCCYSIRVQSHEICQCLFFSAQIFFKQMLDSHFGSQTCSFTYIPNVLYKLTHLFFLSTRVKINPKYKITTLIKLAPQIQFNYIGKYGSQNRSMFSIYIFIFASHKIQFQFNNNNELRSTLHIIQLFANYFFVPQ